MAIHGFSRISIDIREYPWNSVDSHGFRTNIYNKKKQEFHKPGMNIHRPGLGPVGKSRARARSRARSRSGCAGPGPSLEGRPGPSLDGQHAAIF